MNPSQIRRNAIGGVQLGRLYSVDPTSPNALAREVRRTAGVRSGKNSDIIDTNSAFRGVPAVEMIGQTGPMYISNDDVAERRQSPVDYRFGVDQGRYVANGNGRVYPEAFNLIPQRDSNGRSVPISQNTILGQIDDIGMSGVMENPESKFLEGAMLRDERAAQGYTADGMTRYGGDFGASQGLMGSLLAGNLAKRQSGGVTPDMQRHIDARFRNGISPRMGDIPVAPEYPEFVARYQPRDRSAVDAVVARYNQRAADPNLTYMQGFDGQYNPAGLFADRPEVVSSVLGKYEKDYADYDSALRAFNTAPTNYNPGALSAAPARLFQPQLPSIDVTSSLFRETPLRNYSQSQELVPNQYGVLVAASRQNSLPMEPIGGIDYQTMAPTIVKSGFNSVELPSTVYADKGLTAYPINSGQRLTDGREDDIGFNGYNDYGNSINNPFGDYELPSDQFIVPKKIPGDSTRVIVRNNTTAYDQVDRLEKAARSANIGYQYNLSETQDFTGYPASQIEGDLILRTIGKEDPELEMFARRMADQPQSAALSTATALRNVPLNGIDERLLNSFQQQQEMARRAQFGQIAYDNNERQAMPLPDVEPVRVSVLDEDGNFSQTVQDMDYRDMLAQRRQMAQQGYGQLQQRLPVSYDQNGDRYPVVQVGPVNIDAYQHGNEYKADVAAQANPFTVNNQFFAGPRENRIMHGQQSLPITLGVNPSRADDFVPDEAIRIQPGYSYSRADFQNTAGNRMRGEGYVEPPILTPAELARRRTQIKMPYGFS